MDERVTIRISFWLLNDFLLLSRTKLKSINLFCCVYEQISILLCNRGLCEWNARFAFSQSLDHIFTCPSLCRKMLVFPFTDYTQPIRCLCVPSKCKCCRCRSHHIVIILRCFCLSAAAAVVVALLLSVSRAQAQAIKAKPYHLPHKIVVLKQYTHAYKTIYWISSRQTDTELKCHWFN